MSTIRNTFENAGDYSLSMSSRFASETGDSFLFPDMASAGDDRSLGPFQDSRYYSTMATSSTCPSPHSPAAPHLTDSYMRPLNRRASDGGYDLHSLDSPHYSSMQRFHPHSPALEEQPYPSIDVPPPDNFLFESPSLMNSRPSYMPNANIPPLPPRNYAQPAASASLAQPAPLPPRSYIPPRSHREAFSATVDASFISSLNPPDASPSSSSLASPHAPAANWTRSLSVVSTDLHDWDAQPTRASGSVMTASAAPFIAAGQTSGGAEKKEKEEKQPGSVGGRR